MAGIRNQSIGSLFKIPSLALTMFGVAFLFFDLQYYLMASLPGYVENMCIPGAGLSLLNISFALILSLLVGVFVVGVYTLVKTQRPSLSIFSISGLAAFLGSITVFCVPCVIPVLSVFGIAVGLGFVSVYNLWIKIISVGLMLLGLYLLNKQLRGNCTRCVR